MTISEQLRAKEAELKPRYEAIQQKRATWEELQTVEQALTARNEALAKEQSDLDRASERRDNLRREKERLARRSKPAPTVRFGGGTNFSTSFQRSQAVHSDPAAPPPQPPTASDPSMWRQRLKKMVGQLRHFWQLDGETVGRINRIADDASRPLGEALALLEWRLYTAPIHPGETDEARLQRLTQWGAELERYERVLEGDINAQRNRYRNVLYIWEQWQAGQENPAVWDAFIADQRQALQEERASVQAEIETLQAEIARLRQAGDAGEDAA